MSTYSSQEILDLIPEAEELSRNIEKLKRTAKSAPENMSTEAKIAALAVLSACKVAQPQEISERVAHLSTLNEHIENSRGELVVWFSTDEKMTRHSSGGENEYSTIHLLNIATLAPDATLKFDQHNSSGAEIPVTNTKSSRVYGTEIHKGKGATPDFDFLQIGDPETSHARDASRVEVPLDIKKFRNFPLLIGNKEVEGMINRPDLDSTDNRSILQPLLAS